MMLSTLRGRLKIVFLSAVVPLIWMAGCEHGSESASAPHAVAEGPESAATQPSGPSVSIDNFTFSPSVITVHAGTTVTWVNHDDVPHTVTANDKGFASKTLDTDDRFSHVFTAPGTYPYYCAVHKHMTGQVIVTK
jgi:plastocyanin